MFASTLGRAKLFTPMNSSPAKIHESVARLLRHGAKPVDAHQDENRVNAKVNLTLKQKHFRKYPQLTFGDKVNIIYERSW